MRQCKQCNLGLYFHKKINEISKSNEFKTKSDGQKLISDLGSASKNKLCRKKIQNLFKMQLK